MKPKVSLVMSVYNQDKFLKEAIKSILSQTFKDFEFLILDDASIDESLTVIKSFKDKRIRLFTNKKRHGLTKGLNFLISKARGDYLCRMDADDISIATRLKEQVEYLERYPQFVLVGSFAKIINEKGRTVGEFRYPTGYQEIRRVILSYNPFIHSSVMFRKKALEKIGRYDEDLFYSQDYDLFLRFVVKCPCANLAKFLLKFRWEPDFKKQKEQHWQGLKIKLKAIKEYGYSNWEIIKLIKPLFFYLVPSSIKKIYWHLRLS